jgi:hypothetical protein
VPPIGIDAVIRRDAGSTLWIDNAGSGSVWREPIDEAIRRLAAHADRPAKKAQSRRSALRGEQGLVEPAGLEPGAIQTNSAGIGPKKCDFGLIVRLADRRLPQSSPVSTIVRDKGTIGSERIPPSSKSGSDVPRLDGLTDLRFGGRPRRCIVPLGTVTVAQRNLASAPRVRRDLSGAA